MLFVFLMGSAMPMPNLLSLLLFVMHLLVMLSLVHPVPAPSHQSCLSPVAVTLGVIWLPYLLLLLLLLLLLVEMTKVTLPPLSRLLLGPHFP
jgi:hypothetical protein